MPKIPIKNIFARWIVGLVLFFIITGFLYPNYLFPHIETEPRFRSALSPQSLSIISNSKILVDSSKIVFNWAIFSPWGIVKLVETTLVDCHGTFWFCPGNELFGVLIILFIFYATIIYIFLKSKEKRGIRKLLISLIVYLWFCFVVIGVIVARIYVYDPYTFHNQVLTQLQSKNNQSFPDGFKVNFYNNHIIVEHINSDFDYFSGVIYYQEQESACITDRGNTEKVFITTDFYKCRGSILTDYNKVEHNRNLYVGFLDQDHHFFVSTNEIDSTEFTKKFWSYYRPELTNLIK